MNRALNVVRAADVSVMDDHDNHLHLPGAGFTITRSRHLRDHLVWMRLCGLSDRTLYARRRAVVLLAEHIGHDPVDAGYGELEAWQVHLSRTSLNTVRWMTSVVRPYFVWLQRRGLRNDNPAALLPMPKKRRTVPRPMAESKVVGLIAAARPRLRPWLILAGWSGLRAEEIAELRVEQFYADAEGDMWVRVIGKGEVERDAPIPDWGWPYVAEALPAGAEHGPCWRRERGFGPVLPVHVSQLCNRFLHDQLGIPDTLHSLRHRVGTLALEHSGRDIRLVADLLGHAQISTTQGYTRVNPRRIALVVNDLPRPDLPTPTAGRHLRVVDDTAHGGTA